MGTSRPKPAAATTTPRHSRRAPRNETKREASLDWLLQRAGAPPMTDAERDALLAEIDGANGQKRRLRKAAG